MSISTIHSDKPAAIRREAVAHLRKATGATRGLYFETAEVDGELFYTKVTSSGPAPYEAFLSAMEGTRLRSGAVATAGEHALRARRDRWTIHRPGRARLAEFRALRDDIDVEQFRKLPVWKDLYVGADITTDQLRVLIYDRGKYVGWFGVFRGGDESVFDPVQQARANKKLHDLRGHVLAARHLESTGAQPIGSLLFSAGGRLEFASPDVIDLSDDQLAVLRRAVRCADAGRLARDTLAFHNIAAHILRMDAPDRVAYLVRLEPAQPPRFRAEILLTDRQLEVAKLAATGATVETISAALEVQPTTVKYHLREAYRRLDIETRAELATLLAS